MNLQHLTLIEAILGCPRSAGPVTGKEIDFGGCRCQALAILGDASAADPVCSKAHPHSLVIATDEIPQAGEVATSEQITYRPNS